MKKYINIILAIISIILIRMIALKFRLDIIRLTIHMPLPHIIKSIIWGWY